MDNLNSLIESIKKEYEKLLEFKTEKKSIKNYMRYLDNGSFSDLLEVDFEYLKNLIEDDNLKTRLNDLTSILDDLRDKDKEEVNEFSKYFSINNETKKLLDDLKEILNKRSLYISNELNNAKKTKQLIDYLKRLNNGNALLDKEFYAVIAYLKEKQVNIDLLIDVYNKQIENRKKLKEEKKEEVNSEDVELPKVKEQTKEEKYDEFVGKTENLLKDIKCDNEVINYFKSILTYSKKEVCSHDFDRERVNLPNFMKVVIFDVLAPKDNNLEESVNNYLNKYYDLDTEKYDFYKRLEKNIKYLLEYQKKDKKNSSRNFYQTIKGLLSNNTYDIASLSLCQRDPLLSLSDLYDMAETYYREDFYINIFEILKMFNGDIKTEDELKTVIEMYADALKKFNQKFQEIKENREKIPIEEENDDKKINGNIIIYLNPDDKINNDITKIKDKIKNSEHEGLDKSISKIVEKLEKCDVNKESKSDNTIAPVRSSQSQKSGTYKYEHNNKLYSLMRIKTGKYGSIVRIPYISLLIPEEIKRENNLGDTDRIIIVTGIYGIDDFDKEGKTYDSMIADTNTYKEELDKIIDVLTSNDLLAIRKLIDENRIITSNILSSGMVEDGGENCERKRN